jgi:hypothetical protein
MRGVRVNGTSIERRTGHVNVKVEPINRGEEEGRYA